MRIAFMATALPALAGAAHADADPFERRFDDVFPTNSRS
jgi:hypothetical protein